MKSYLSILLGLVFNLAFSQSEQVELSAYLKNGDVITGKSDLLEISFQTDFGKLIFPIDQVNSISLGLKDSRFDKANLLQLLEKIDKGTDKEKEKAFDEVLLMEEGAIPFVKAYLNAPSQSSNASSSDLNIQTLYEVLLAKNKVPRNYNLYDVLSYKDEFRVEGSYDFNSLYIDTDYGKIKINRNDIARLDFKIVSQGMANNKSFKLFANQHISANKDEAWLNTGILVKKGEKITITASGQIVLASLSGNTYTADGGVNGSAGIDDNKLSYGQIVYKIGQGGVLSKAGNNLNAYAANTGIIYLAIYESVYNSANSGYYTVKVRVD
ncbi:MAG: hypothetical protein H6579_00705 [Chitinophagales bacterium]|nr:hypothetical protein [Chitinophagales bacterium]